MLQLVLAQSFLHLQKVITEARIQKSKSIKLFENFVDIVLDMLRLDKRDSLKLIHKLF